MTVKKINFGEWMSTLTGHTYTSVEAARHYDSRAAMEQDATADLAEEARKKLTSEEELALWRLASRESDAEKSKAAFEAQATIFVENNPDYVACESNSRQIVSFLAGRGCINPSCEDLQEAFNFLCARGAMKLKEGKPGEPSAHEAFDEAAAYTMDLADLRRLACGGFTPGEF